jgi:hypothetical protein
LNDQSRSLLASSRSIPGRRFSATQETSGTVTSAFSEWLANSGVNQFGTAFLMDPPRFSWDGYAAWLNSGPPLPKTAALRTHLVLSIDDIAFGTTTASVVFDVIFKRTGGATPIELAEESSFSNLTQPWAGDSTNPRWEEYLSFMCLSMSSALVQQIGVLAGASAGSVRILPGRSTLIPKPPATHWGLIEIGRTDDDATIALLP